VGLTIARRILDQQPALQLFSLRAHAVRRRLDIAIDKVIQLMCLRLVQFCCVAAPACCA